MAVTLDDVSRHLLAKTADALSEPERAAVAEAHAMATGAVAAYVRGSTVPATVERSAVLRLAFFDYWSRLARRPNDAGTLAAGPFRRDAPLAPLRASGAMALLSPYKRRGVGVAQ